MILCRVRIPLSFSLLCLDLVVYYCKHFVSSGSYTSYLTFVIGVAQWIFGANGSGKREARLVIYPAGTGTYLLMRQTKENSNFPSLRAEEGSKLIYLGYVKRYVSLCL